MSLAAKNLPLLLATQVVQACHLATFVPDTFCTAHQQTAVIIEFRFKNSGLAQEFSDAGSNSLPNGISASLEAHFSDQIG